MFLILSLWIVWRKWFSMVDFNSDVQERFSFHFVDGELKKELAHNWIPPPTLVCIFEGREKGLLVLHSMRIVAQYNFIRASKKNLHYHFCSNAHSNQKRQRERVIGIQIEIITMEYFRFPAENGMNAKGCRPWLRLASNRVGSNFSTGSSQYWGFRWIA
jgi:hypothetical protein